MIGWFRFTSPLFDDDDDDDDVMWCGVMWCGVIS